MSEYATYLKVGATCLMLAMVEDASTVLRDLTLENPIRAIREISQDPTCRRKVRARQRSRDQRARDPSRSTSTARCASPSAAGLPPDLKQALEMWQHCVDGIERDPMSLDREVDWVMKLKLIDQVRERHQVPLSHPMVSVVDLRYHDIDRARGLFYKLQQRGLVERTTTDEAISEATTVPPQTTRARLRGAFVKRAKERRRDYTVDWVHLKLNDQAQRTVLLKDPFKSHDERVERLIESLSRAERRLFNLDPGKLLVIAVVAIILLGPDRLPRVAHQLGGAWRSFDEFRHRVESEVRSTMPDLPRLREYCPAGPLALGCHPVDHVPGCRDSGEAPDGQLPAPALRTARQRLGGCSRPPRRRSPDATSAEPTATTPRAPSTPTPTTPTPTPTNKPTPTPVRADRPSTTSQPSGAVVPADPTLN